MTNAFDAVTELGGGSHENMSVEDKKYYDEALESALQDGDMEAAGLPESSHK